MLKSCGRIEEARGLCYPHYARWRKYGLSVDEFVALLDTSGDTCDLCGLPPTSKGFVVDHDHADGAVRGLLCGHCNAMLGQARDNPDVLLAGAMYLLRTTDVLNLASASPLDGQP